MQKSIIIASMLFAATFSYTANSALVTFDVYAYENSSSGGTGLNTGITFSSGDLITGFVDQTDLWSAGNLPRWSNADGLVTDLFATGTDDSGQPSGTLIGSSFGYWTQNGLAAPFGSLVGKINNVFFLLGTNFSSVAPENGTLSLYYWDSDAVNNAQFVTVSIENGISEVPVPAAAWLFGSGLVGLLAFNRRHKAKAG